jgi:hypothetical protein
LESESCGGWPCSSPGNHSELISNHQRAQNHASEQEFVSRCGEAQEWYERVAGRNSAIEIEQRQVHEKTWNLNRQAQFIQSGLFEKGLTFGA